MKPHLTLRCCFTFIIVTLAAAQCGSALGFTCNINGSPVVFHVATGAIATADITVHPQEITGGTGGFAISLKDQLQCWSDIPWYDDFVDVYGRFEGGNSGLTDITEIYANGALVPLGDKAKVADMPYGTKAWLDIALKIKMSDVPGVSQFIPAGSLLGSVKLYQYNNSHQWATMYLRLYPDRDMTINTSSCELNGNEPMTIDLPTVSNKIITSDYKSTAARRDIDIGVKCKNTSINDRVKVYVYGVNSTDVPDSLQTNAQNLGIQIINRENNELIKPGQSSTTNLVNGFGTIRLLAAAIKKDGVDVVSGHFSGNMIVAISLD